MKHLNTESDFNEFIKTNEKVMIDFYATWCGPCKTISPYFEELSKLFPKIAFAKVNCDENLEICQEYEISSLPTFVSIHNGEIVTRVTGSDKARLQNIVSHL